MIFAPVQEEVGLWSRQNFGHQSADNPLFGLAEEVGELSHAHLKGEQGIRHTPDEIKHLKQDALADIAIYLMDFCSRIDVKLVGRWINSDFVVKEYKDLILKDIIILTGRICENYLRGEDVSMNAERLLMNLSKYAFNHDWDFEQILVETWDKVRQRNWKENPYASPK